MRSIKNKYNDEEYDDNNNPPVTMNVNVFTFFRNLM